MWENKERFKILNWNRAEIRRRLSQELNWRSMMVKNGQNLINVKEKSTGQRRAVFWFFLSFGGALLYTIKNHFPQVYLWGVKNVTNMAFIKVRKLRSRRHGCFRSLLTHSKLNIHVGRLELGSCYSRACCYGSKGRPPIYSTNSKASWAKGAFILLLKWGPLPAVILFWSGSLRSPRVFLQPGRSCKFSSSRGTRIYALDFGGKTEVTRDTHTGVFSNTAAMELGHYLGGCKV